MARIRTIKPEFWEDEKIGCLSHGARLLFLCSLNLCDDEGYLRWNAFFLASHAFMYDDIKLETIEKWMIELIDNDLVYVFAAGRQTVGHITNFLKHQRIDKPQPSRYAELDPRTNSKSDSQNDSKNSSENDSESDSQNDSKNSSENDSENDSRQEKEGEKEMEKELESLTPCACASDFSNDSLSPAEAKAEKEKSSAKKEKGAKRYNLDFVDPPFMAAFVEWLEYKIRKGEAYKDDKTVKTCYNLLIRDCNADPTVAAQMVERSIACNYSGLFPPKKGDRLVEKKSELAKAVQTHQSQFGDKPLAF